MFFIFKNEGRGSYKTRLFLSVLIKAVMLGNIDKTAFITFISNRRKVEFDCFAQHSFFLEMKKSAKLDFLTFERERQLISTLMQ